jgi:hypothetical protein
MESTAIIKKLEAIESLGLHRKARFHGKAKAAIERQAIMKKP